MSLLADAADTRFVVDRAVVFAQLNLGVHTMGVSADPLTSTTSSRSNMVWRTRMRMDYSCVRKVSAPVLFAVVDLASQAAAVGDELPITDLDGALE